MAMPRIAGWGDEFSYPNIHVPLYLVYQDLKEVEENPKLIRSESWLSKTAKNLCDLNHHLERMQQKRSLNHDLMPINNWFHSVSEEKHILSEILDGFKAKGFDDLKPLQKYMEALVKKDPDGLSSLLHYFERYLESK